MEQDHATRCPVLDRGRVAISLESAADVSLDLTGRPGNDRHPLNCVNGVRDPAQVCVGGAVSRKVRVAPSPHAATPMLLQSDLTSP